MTYAQRLRYISALRFWVRFVHETMGYSPIPAYLRVSVMSHARREATGPHTIWETE